ncbi:MAG TPA: ribonuclease P protein component, partial [bacterium]|nr:ribonuclease P protein component [bacterium]
MLPKDYRLVHDRDFQRVYRGRQSVRCPEGAIFFIPNHQGKSRFGFVVSKKFGSATARNRVKRLYREAVRLNLSQIQSGYDFVISIRASKSDSTLWHVQPVVLGLYKRARLL